MPPARNQKQMPIKQQLNTAMPNVYDCTMRVMY